MLYDVNSTATEQFDALVKAKEFAASETLPSVQKNKLNRQANNPTIVEARNKVDQLTKRYNISKSRVTRKHLQEAKGKLHEEYVKVEAESLKQQIANIEIEIQGKDTGKAWNIVNSITNRKASPTGKL